jgi:hypothetical protein
MHYIKYNAIFKLADCSSWFYAPNHSVYMTNQTGAYNLFLQYYTKFVMFGKYALLNNAYDRLVIVSDEIKWLLFLLQHETALLLALLFRYQYHCAFTLIYAYNLDQQITNLLLHCDAVCIHEGSSAHFRQKLTVSSHATVTIISCIPKNLMPLTFVTCVCNGADFGQPQHTTSVDAQNTYLLWWCCSVEMAHFSNDLIWHV